MKQVKIQKNIDALKKQVAIFNAKAITGGDGGTITAAPPSDEEETARRVSIKRITPIVG